MPKSNGRNFSSNRSLPTRGSLRTRGPVADLEAHLPTDWWRTMFAANYLKTDGDVVENPRNTGDDIDRVLSMVPLQPSDAVLDLCCGQGRHALELAGRGFLNVTGLDQSGYLVGLARRRARRQNAAVTFRRGDARCAGFLRHSFQCVLLLGNSFGYFDREQDDATVLRAVHKALVPGGTLVLDLVDGDWLRRNFEPRSWEWIGPREFVCRERSLSADGSRLVAREVIAHAVKGVVADQFYAERLYSRERIRQSLHDAGFESVYDHGNVGSNSERNQDIGMMAQRMFLAARAATDARTLVEAAGS